MYRASEVGMLTWSTLGSCAREGLREGTAFDMPRAVKKIEITLFLIHILSRKSIIVNVQLL